MSTQVIIDVSTNQTTTVVSADDSAITETAAAAVRERRNELLIASDWTQVPDVPVDKVAWAAYRQALRDIPAQPGFPLNVSWPEQPVSV
jgi:hypothetical protein